MMNDDDDEERFHSWQQTWKRLQ